VLFCTYTKDKEIESFSLKIIVKNIKCSQNSQFISGHRVNLQFLMFWDLNSGLCTYKRDAPSLEPHLQPFLL
jgi:hypothetical protein